MKQKKVKQENKSKKTEGKFNTFILGHKEWRKEDYIVAGVFILMLIVFVWVYLKFQELI